MSRTSPLPFGTKWVGCSGAEISKLQLTNKFRSFKPEGFETLLLQKGCFAFRSPAKIDFVLKFKSSGLTVWCFTSVALYKLRADRTENPVVLFVSSDRTENFSRIFHCCGSTNYRRVAERRRDVFTTALRSNVRDADLIESSFSVEMCLPKPLLSNSLRKYATISINQVTGIQEEPIGSHTKTT
jgi:hypothetical protein